MTLSQFLPRPSVPQDTLRRAGLIESPVVALFDDADLASAAPGRVAATEWRHRTPCVVVLAPDPGLRERLYAAGAILVVG
ncbi:hypothetical protein [Roseomonas sp. 18066]|uniref:hypothetical protein n=1 Tax=Roseomonas sp. 18066 TaxID=2681412 RepID=UPI00135A8B05|nr:hypothetical protein [Roseomonas sp. 18066]